MDEAVRDPGVTRESMAVTVALWPLPAIAALLPFVAGAQALAIYTHNQGVFCNPFFDDCISISRMAKYGLANQIFRALVLPGAALQVLTWLLAVHALRVAGLPRSETKLMVRIGVVAAAMLVVYGSFLGTDGAIYGVLRKWGTAVYFAGTYFAMLLFARAAQKLETRDGLVVPRVHTIVMKGLLLLITFICLAHATALIAADKSWVHRLENLTEWYSASAMLLFFVTMAHLWRHWGLRADLHAQPAAAVEPVAAATPAAIEPITPLAVQPVLRTAPRSASPDAAPAVAQ